MNRWSAALLAAARFLALLFFGAIITGHSDYKVHRYGRETSAPRAMQTINTAQVQFNSQFGPYARSLHELGSPAANLIPADLAAGAKLGYTFTLHATPAGYSVQAAPVAFGATGSRTFYSDQALIIRENYGPQPATAHSKEVGSAAAGVLR
jgi:type IV pilus assembly protein PilA